MEAWIAFGRGPLFRLSFVLMLLGIARILYLGVVTGNQMKAMSTSSRTDQPGYWKTLTNEIGLVGKLWRWRPFHSAFTTLFHLGFVIVPLFLASHVVQWRKGVGFSWWEMPQTWADQLTISVIALAPILTLFQLFGRVDRSPGRIKRSFIPLLLATPFATGYICVNGVVSPTFYYTSMLTHIWVGNLIMLAIPFTSLGKCILAPASKLAFTLWDGFATKIEPVVASFTGRSEV